MVQVKEVLRIGQKVLGGGLRIGKKILGFFKKKMGEKTAGKAEQLDPDATSLSYKDFDDNSSANVPPPPAIQLQPNTPRLKPSNSIGNKVRAGREAVKLAEKVRDNPSMILNTKQIKREKNRIKNIAEAPSKKSFKKTSDLTKAQQEAQMVGSMNQKQFKKWQKKQEKRSKKRNR